MELADRRRLPDEVRARLARADAPAGLDGFSVVKRGRIFEARRSVEWEMRASAEDLDKALVDKRGEIPIVGYATTYDQPYEVYGGAASGWGWDEVMAPGSWARTISQGADIRFLVNHDGLALARTSSETMKLVSDDVGVLVDATLDMRSSLARDLAVSVSRGDVSQMSCAFVVTKQTWSPDYDVRRIEEVIGYDVSAVTYPANEATLVIVAAAADEEPPSSSTPPEPVGRRMSLSLARATADRLRLASTV